MLFLQIVLCNAITECRFEHPQEYFILIFLRYSLRFYSSIANSNRKFATTSWPVWLNGWVFVYELSDCGFESRWCHLIAVLLLLSELLHFSRLSSMVFEFFLLVKSILTLLRQPYPTLLHLVFCCRLLWLIDVILSRYQVITRFVEGLH